MSKRSLQISQIIALLTAAETAAEYLLLLIRLDQRQPEIIYGMLFPVLPVTGFLAAFAYAVSLIWLFIYRIKQGSFGNRSLSLMAVAIPAILFAWIAATFRAG